MGKKSRSKYVVINIVVGFMSQIIILLLSFVTRTLFLQYLNVDYLGINGLYTNILTVLSLAELGIGNVMAFSLYKPILDNDQERITALLDYFRKLYLKIIIAISVLGLLLIPLLRYFVQSNLSQRDLIFYYLLILLNTVLTYFVAHKTTCITAHQDQYIIKNITTVTTLVTYAFQITLLILFRNYYIYLVVLVVSTILKNLLVSIQADKRYPYITSKQMAKIDNLNQTISKNIKATFVYKLGVTIVVNTDNILISALIGTTVVGYYSNYYMVVSNVQVYLNIIISTLIPSLGNLTAEGDKRKSVDIFYILLLFFHWSAAFGSISFLLIFNDFITAWIGQRYVLEYIVVIAIATNYYISNAVNPVWMFREATGLFTKVKFLMLTTAIINLVMSIVLGKLMGLAGILFATAIARILTLIWYEPRILFSDKLGGNQRRYWLTQLKYLVMTAVSFGICWSISGLLPTVLVAMIVKGLIFFFVTVMLFALSAVKSQEFIRLLEYLNLIMVKIRMKKV